MFVVHQSQIAAIAAPYLILGKASAFVIGKRKPRARRSFRQQSETINMTLRYLLRSWTVPETSRAATSDAC